MKKYITGFIVLLMLSLCLSFHVSAAEADFTIAEDFQSLTYHGITFHRENLTMVSFEYYSDFEETPALTSGQQALLRDCSFQMDSSKRIVEAEFFFRDGSTLLCSYVSETFREQFRNYLTSDATECYTQFYWDSLHRPKAAEARFKGTATTLKGRVLRNAEAFPVYVNQDFWDFTILKGSLLVVQDRFYYVDHQQIGLYQNYAIDLYEIDSVECYEVTDPELCAELEDAMGAYYNAAYNSVQALDIAAFLFWTFIFAVIPATILVLSVIFFIRGRGYYRLTWGATGGFAALSLILYFVVMHALLMAS